MKYSKEQLEAVFKGNGYKDERNNTCHLFKGTFTQEDLDSCKYVDSIKCFFIDGDVLGACYRAAEYILDNGLVNYYVYGDNRQNMIMVYSK